MYINSPNCFKQKNEKRALYLIDSENVPESELKITQNKCN